jgi:O-antigen/teichoic acid export membrane protein
MGKVKARAKIIFIALITNIVLNLIFIQVWGVIGAVAAMMISWIMLCCMSYREIDKDKEISFDRRYLIKNLISIGILSATIYYIKNKVFILEDIHRYENLFYFIIICIGYYICIAGINYKSIVLMKKEFSAIRKSR